MCWRIINPMSHLLCPLCGKYSALSTLISNELEPDLKVVSFKGLGRKKGFVRSEVYSILGDDEYTPIIVDRIDNARAHYPYMRLRRCTRG